MNKTLGSLVLAALALGVFVAARAEAPDGTAVLPPPVPIRVLTSTAGMAHISGGAFSMGCSPGDSECASDEKPTHQVAVGDFWMDVNLVTNAQYRECVSAGRCAAIDENACFNRWNTAPPQQVESVKARFGGAEQPVVCVSWNQAAGYCRSIGKHLPTEAEWEFAARGGTTGAHYGDLDAIAWHNGNSDWATHSVGQRKPNAYGLYDMLGNVREWCADWYGKDYYASSASDNPEGPNSGADRVLRGGAWSSDPKTLRASIRDRYDPANGHDSIGFRCVRD